MLVSGSVYDAAGRLWKSIDPKAVESRTTYDLAGRTTKVIENYVNGAPSDADDRTTEYTWTGLDQVLTEKAVMPAGQVSQTTGYYYKARTLYGQNVDSHDWLVSVSLPDPVTGNFNFGDMTTQEVFYYNALGEVRAKKDRNGTEEYMMTRDAVGRIENVRIANPASHVDHTIKRIHTTYDTAGRRLSVSSDLNFSGTPSINNEVQFVYNGLGQLTTEYQEHAGAVNTSTSAKVQYAYDATASGGVFTKSSRLSSMTYPNGRVLDYTYGTAGGLDDTIGRLAAMQESVGGVTTSLESYSYLGGGTIVNMGHSQTGVDLTYIDPLGLPGDGGDKYAGLDRFGRINDQRWYKASTATDVDRFQHTYDRNSNRLTRDVTATGAPATLDEAYTYDNLDRLTKVNQGTLASGTITDLLATYSKAWNLDALGNWKTMVEDLDGGGSGTATTQSRTANARNQISSITGLTTPTYDAKGNMIAEETGQKLVYDGWDRLTKVQDSASQNKVSYTYDGLGRRIKRTDHGANLTSTADDVTTDIYYGGAADWQVLEERVGSTIKNQYVWSPKYIDAMVLRDRDATTGGDLGKTSSGLDERLYPTHDSNFNITAILDIAGAVVERFRSDAYGNNLTIMNAAWQTVTEMKEWQHFFQGGRRDGISDLYHFRNREYDPVLAVWTRMDPWGYVDGMSLYQWERSNPVVGVDPFGLALYAFSGIFSDGQNYVDLFIRQFWGLPTATEDWMRSDLALDVVLGLFGLLSEIMLDAEARRLARENVPAGCRCDGAAPRRIRVLMIAPKTDTLPPQGNCCDIQFTVLWSDRDGVPNQWPFNQSNRRFWERFGGPNRTYNVDPPGNAIEDHDFEGYLDEPPLRIRRGGRWRTDPNQTAPNAQDLVKGWMQDPNVDDVLVCHSQGCNIMMHALRRACERE